MSIRPSRLTGVPLPLLLPLLLALLLPVACGGDGMGHHGAGDGHDDASEVVDGARRIEVAATSFEFDPAAITVDAGEDVAIVLTSDDLLHDFAIDGHDVHVSADKGETAEGGLRVDEPGTYTFYCTVPGHNEAGMDGTLTVLAA